MERFAVFVDAGYLFAAGSTLLTGEKRPRSELRLDDKEFVRAIIRFGREMSGRDLLRVYWYDGTSSGPTAHQLALANLDDVKLRLGLVNSSGEQKGVDSLIVTDMIALARNRAMTDAVLLAGDEDLRVGVQQAQEFGVRVHLLGIASSERNQSQYMRQEVDTRREWDATALTGLLFHQPRTVPGVPTPVNVPAILDAVILALSPVERSATLASYDAEGAIPSDVDRLLLAEARRQFSRALSQSEKHDLRAEFIAACRAVVPPAAT